MDNLYEWIYDDITWCGNECSHTECERNLFNRLTKGGLYSAALFKDTEMCPLSPNYWRKNSGKQVSDMENE